jgi:hypothetical protein
MIAVIFRDLNRQEGPPLAASSDPEVVGAALRMLLQRCGFGELLERQEAQPDAFTSEVPESDN